VDAVAATLMGFDWKRLPVIREAFREITMPISEVDPLSIQIVSDIEEWNGSLNNLRNQEHFDFIPHFGWKGHIELPNHKSL